MSGKIDGWQDIETAPRDGTWLLLTKGKIPYVGAWDSEDEVWFTYNQGYEYAARIANKQNEAEVMPLPYQPTHWQPLPAPPGAAHD